jgi:hypothetical protein
MYNVDLQVSKLCNCITNSSFETSYFRYFKATTSKTTNEVGGSKNAGNTTTDANFVDKEVDRKESKETEGENCSNASETTDTENEPAAKKRK